ncbi:MAG: phosphate ABC transporter ATP-binding protein [Planctomycetota bacterium]
MRDVCVQYGQHVALRDVTMEFAHGRIAALVGPSGCGKTTLLTVMNRLTDLIPTCQVSGSCSFGEMDVMSRSIDLIALRRRVGMIFQKPNPFPLSIRKNILLPLRQHGVRDRARAMEIIEQSLRDVGLWDEIKDRLDAPASRLSGGQQQRLCLARTLALEPEILLLDEPCSALDPLASGRVEDLIASLRNRFTVIVVTHNLAQARRIADDVAVFWVADGAGRVIEHGSTQQIFESPQHELTSAYIAGVRG